MNSKYFLYVLRSENYDRHYIGISDNPQKRLLRHNKGDTPSTKPYRPWKVVYTERYASKREARIREIYLKKTARARKDIFDSIARVGLIV